VDAALLRLLRCARGGVGALLLSHWGAAAAAVPAAALAAALARHPSLQRLELDDGTFTAAGAPRAGPPRHASAGPKRPAR
jgi:hypothetical protein